MSLRNRIQKVVNEEISNKSSIQKEQYEDDYDGFTNSTYSGLVDQVEEELINEGFDDNVSNSTIQDFVFQLF